MTTIDLNLLPLRGVDWALSEAPFYIMVASGVVYHLQRDGTWATADQMRRIRASTIDAVVRPIVMRPTWLCDWRRSVRAKTQGFSRVPRAMMAEILAAWREKHA